MKIALVRREFSKLGGAELYLQRLIKVMRGEGHHVVLVTAEAPEDIPGVNVLSVKLSGDRADRTYWFGKLARRELQHERVDCVFSLERMGGQDVYRAGDGVHSVWLAQRRQYASWWRRP